MIAPSPEHPWISRSRLAVGLGGLLLVGAILLPGASWESGSGFHTAVETLASLLATTVGLVLIYRYRRHSSGSRFFIGIGFVATGLLDAGHAAVTSAYFAPIVPADLSSLIPWSWTPPRLLLSTVLLLSWWLWRSESTERRFLDERGLYFLFALYASACFLFFAVAELPPAYFAELLTPRPQELVPGLLFAVALAGYLHARDWRENFFEFTVVLSLIVNVSAQFGFMAFSSGLYDAGFDAAHVLKIASYVVALVGAVRSPPAVAPSHSRTPLASLSAQELKERATAVTRTFVCRSVLAGLALGIAALATHWLQQRYFRLAQDDVAIVNTAGRLRMLGQKSGLLASELLRNPTNAERTRLQAELAEVAGALETHHRRLSLLGRTPGDEVSRRLGELITHIRSLSKDRAEALSAADSDAHHILDEVRSGALVAALESSVSRLEADARERLEFLERQSFAVILWGLVVLILSAVFVVWPMVKRLREVLLREAILATEDANRHFDLSLDLFCVAGLDGCFKRVNPAFERILGYSATDLLEKPFIEFVHPDDVAPTLAEVEALDRGRNIIGFENRYRCKNGEWRQLSWMAQALPQEGLIYASARDVTEERRLSKTLERQVAELHRSNQELDDFAYVASHDLKSPLRDIHNLAAWINEDLSGTLPPTSESHLEKMVGRVERMEKLLDDLLEYSRVGRIESSIEDLEPEELVQHVTELLSFPPQFTCTVTNGSKIHLRSPKAPLEQVLRNLIGNAVKHHDRTDGHVDVQCRDAGEHVEFRVADDGPGIDPQYQEKVFRMFQKLGMRDEVEGSGIGLALVKKLVEHHGGSIKLHSSVGKGATFTFTWPKRWHGEEVAV